MTNHNHVILSEAKDLKVYVTVEDLTLREILHFVQNDNLSSPKHTHRPTPSRVPPLFVGYKNVTHDVVVVILSKAKDLKVYVTVDGRTDSEILHYAQDDKSSHSSSLRGIALDAFTDTRYLTCNSVAIYH